MQVRWSWILIFQFLVMSQGQAQSQVSYSCVFDRPFYYGASIMAGYGSMVDGFRGQMAKGPIEGANPSPLTLMARELAPQGEIVNVAEIVNTMPFSSIGFLQLDHSLGVQAPNPNLQQYSLLASLDGFYWPTVYTGYSCDHVVDGAQQIIAMARESEIPLILATVPHETAALVSPVIRSAGWGEPRPACVQHLNALLVQQCQKGNLCFLIDLDEVVQQLNSERGLEMEGVTYRALNYDEMLLQTPEVQKQIQEQTPTLRSDGVHLNADGIRYVRQKIDQELSSVPDLCPQK